MKPKQTFQSTPGPAPQEDPRNSGARLRTAARASGLEAPSQRYQQLRAVLVRYLSPLLVDSVLERALQDRGLSAGALSNAALADLISDSMIGLRLFVADTQLSAVMLELAEILELEDER